MQEIETVWIFLVQSELTPFIFEVVFYMFLLPNLLDELSIYPL